MIEDYKKAELKQVLSEIKSIVESVPAEFCYGGDCDNKAREVVHGIVRNLINVKLETEINKRVAFYDIEHLLYILKKLDEKPIKVCEGVGSADGTAGEVQPRPSLESPGKQKVSKGSKKPVLKRV